ncbi:type VI secretion system Vgr family protein, partial [Shigella boydii]
FHWDRLAKGDDTSSCWVRVSSAWAGQGFGGVQIPRVGDEVVIDFINGDPDRPIVTGRVYNEASMPPWDLPGNATRMGFMTRSKDGNIDNSSFLFFEDNPGNESVEMHSEKDMKISVENDKHVNIDGCRNTTIGKDQSDTVVGDSSFHYQKKRTTKVEDLELKEYNNGEQTIIKNGRKTDIQNGGDIRKIKGDRELTLDGNNNEEVLANETIHINGKKETTIGNGDVFTIKSGGQKQNIQGKVNVDIDGAWMQTVTGKVKVESPEEIVIKSKTKVFIDSPVFEHNDVEKKSFAQNSMDFIGQHVTISTGSVAFKGVSYAATGINISHQGMTFGRTVINAQRVEAARVDSGSLRTALFALHMLM